jgi:uncharacterized membrane protein
VVKIIVSYVLGFIFTSAVDFMWHILIWGKNYGDGINKVGNVVEGKLQANAVTGLLSQVLVVGSIMFLVLYKNSELNYVDGMLRGAAGGILAISVYGLVNHSLIKNWGIDITILEVVWGPIIGGLSGLFITWITRVLG